MMNESSTFAPTEQRLDKVVYIHLDTDIEAIQADSSALAEMKNSLLEILNVDAKLFELEIEVFSGSVVLRVVIRSKNPGMSEQKGQELLDHFNRPTSVLSSFPVKAAVPTFGNWTAYINTNDFSNTTGSTGDVENFARAAALALARNGTELCSGRKPIAIDCRIIDGRPWYAAGQVLRRRCTAEGIECRSSDNDEGCLDYEVQYLCPTEQAVTNAPIEPFDSCAGVTCSGHGVCRESGSIGLCDCAPGWFRQDCDAVPIGIIVVNNVTECGGPALLQPAPGLQWLECANSELKATGETHVQISILEQPTAAVECVIQSKAPLEAAVIDRTGVFDAESPIGSVVSLRIHGVKDTTLGDGAARFTIAARCTSSDRRFDTASAEASAVVTEIEFPLIESLVPALSSFVGQQVTVQGRGLGEDFDTQVAVGGVIVSGPPVMRTVLLNTTGTENRLWVVNVANGTDDTTVLEWEQAMTALYSEQDDLHGWTKQWKRNWAAMGRRSKGANAIIREAKGANAIISSDGDECQDHDKCHAAVSSSLSGSVLASQWYPVWDEYKKKMDSMGAPPAFAAEETYVGLKLWNDSDVMPSRLNTSMATDGLPDSIILLHHVSPGPLAFRRLLGSVVVVDADDAERNFTLFRELVQPFNFTRTAIGVSFVTPTYDEVQLRWLRRQTLVTNRQDSNETENVSSVNGSTSRAQYINISLVKQSGTAANITELLFYTEDCPSFGMFGRGSSCKACPTGGYCPGAPPPPPPFPPPPFERAFP